MRFDDEGNRRWWPKGNHNTEQQADFGRWIIQLVRAGEWAKLRKIYGELNRHGESFHTLRAASMVKRYLILREEEETPTAPPASLDNLQITDLPKKSWWKLFIDRSKQNLPSDLQNAMRFDLDESPGFYNMMMSAFEARLSNAYNNPQRMDFRTYDAYHVSVTRGAVRKKDDGGFEAVPHALSGEYTEFPMTQADEPEPEALLELIDEGVAGLNRDEIKEYNRLGSSVFNDELNSVQQGQVRAQMRADGIDADLLGLYVLSRSTIQQYLSLNRPDIWDASKNKFANAAYRTARHQKLGNSFLSRFSRTSPGGGRHQVIIRTDIPESSASVSVSSIFDRYRGEIAVAANPDAKLSAICKAIRALHVGHFFADANGRLNTMLILNQLLMEQGFSPAIVRDNSWFGGSKTVDTLVQMVKEGMRAFKEEVRVAHGLPAPVVAAAPVPVVAAAPVPVVAAPAPAHPRARARSLERVRPATAPSGAVPRRRARSFSGSSL